MRFPASKRSLVSLDVCLAVRSGYKLCRSLESEVNGVHVVDDDLRLACHALVVVDGDTPARELLALYRNWLEAGSAERGRDDGLLAVDDVVAVGFGRASVDVLIDVDVLDGHRAPPVSCPLRTGAGSRSASSWPATTSGMFMTSASWPGVGGSP